MKTRGAHSALVALGSQLVASLVSFRATAEPRNFEVPRRAPLVMATTSGQGASERTEVPLSHTEGARVAAASPARQPERRVVVVPLRATTNRDPDPQTQRRMLGFITGSLGIVGLGFGATTSVIALKKDVLDRQCADPVRICSPDGKATSGGVSLSAMSAVGWAFGVVGVSAGTYLIITSNRRTGSETAIGTDFYKGGAGLKVSRYW